MGLKSLWNLFRITRPGTRPRPAPMNLTPWQWEEVEWRISEFISDPTSIYAHVHNAIERENVLPLTFDWTGFMALRSDGQLVWIPYDDEPGEIEPVREERLRNIGLFQGSKLHPDLQFLLPPKPPGAMKCPHCQGAGQLTFPPGVICYCGGLGWLPPARSQLKAIFSWFTKI